MKFRRNILFIGGLVCLGLCIWDARRPHVIKVSASGIDIAYSIIFPVLYFVTGIILLAVAFKSHKKFRAGQSQINNFLSDQAEAEDDFLARLQYRITAQGGRRSAAYTGYRPHIKFTFSTYQTCGQQTFLDQEFVIARWDCNRKN